MAKKGEKIMKEEKKSKFIGLDIGTSFIVAAMESGDKVEYKPIRSAYFGIEDRPQFRKHLERSKLSYLKMNNKLYLVGDSAREHASMFSLDAGRPMKAGVIVPGANEEIDIMRVLIKDAVGVQEGATIVFSCPEPSADGLVDTRYHEDTMKHILLEDVKAGKVIPMNEAHALSFSELADDNFTGICFSYGAGMVNVCLTHNTLDVLKFSIPRGGDWIDMMAAKSRGKTAVQMQMVKEEQMSINDAKDQDQKAIAVYYRDLINTSLDMFNRSVKSSTKVPVLKNPIPVIIAGGTSMVGGFVEVFNTAMNEGGFPFAVSKVIHASDPLKSVANGLLLAAMDMEE